MGFLKNVVKNAASEGISQGISKGISQGLGKAVSDTRKEMDGASPEAKAAAGSGFASLAGSFEQLADSATSYATEMSKKMKHCPNCGEDVLANNDFCPECGAKLPETTIAEQYVCPNCGKQNLVETKFCSGCGTILPWFSAEKAAEERAEQEAAAEQVRLEAEAAAKKAAREQEAKEKAAAVAQEAKEKAAAAMDLGGKMLGGLFGKKKK